MRTTTFIILCMLGLIVFFFFTSPTSFQDIIEKNKESFTLPQSNSQIAYVKHDPIVIINNSGFLTSGFGGYGNLTHPYELEGVNITYDGGCIRISNTTAFFVIRNCLLKSSSEESDSGILLYNVTNALVESCLIVYNRIGVELQESVNCSIYNTTIYDNTEYGAYIRESERCILFNNTIYTGHKGVKIEDSFGIEFVNGTILMTSSDCIDLFNAQNCSIVNSTLDRVQIVHSPYLLMTNNNVLGRVHIHLSYNSTLTLNEIYGSEDYGVFIEDSSNCLITLNNVHSNSPIGVYIDNFSSNNTILDNMIGWNSNINAIDNGTNNNWDDGTSAGNAYGDYNGTGTYVIAGSAGSVDHYPRKADVIFPTCNSPEDFEYEAGSTGNSIFWVPSDAHPKSYLVLRNGSIFESGDWNGTNIVVSIDGLNLGVYNFTILVYDTCYNLVSDFVFVTVADTTAPICDEPLNVQYEAGTTGNNITWTPIDFNPDFHQVFRNGTMITSGDWNGSKLVINVDGLSPGVYNYTLLIFDVNGKSTSDVVIVVVVDTTQPTVDGPIDITYEFGVTGNLITWHPSDLYPMYYEILRNGTNVRSGGWDGSSITIGVDDLSAGVHNYTLVVSDTSGNWVSDTVLVTVTSLAATIVDPMIAITFGGGGFVVVVVIVYLIRRKRKLLPIITPTVIEVKATRGCEIIGGKFHYKVKVKNESDYVITDVNVSILAYPRNCLRLEGSSAKRLERIEPAGFRSPEFIFTPTKDCVEGQVIATVSYVDFENRPRTLDVKLYVIRSVCDLLKPLEASLQEFDLLLADMEVTTEQVRLSSNPEVVFEKSQELLQVKNFYILESSSGVEYGEFSGVIRGLAEGKYTSKKVAIRLTVSGKVDESLTKVDIEGLGEDATMLPTTINEITEGLVN